MRAERNGDREGLTLWREQNKRVTKETQNRDWRDSLSRNDRNNSKLQLPWGRGALGWCSWEGQG